MRKVRRYFSGIIALLLLIASIPVNVFAATGLKITTQPTSQTVLSGKDVTFTVGASGAKTFQWQYYNGTAWKNATNETVWKNNNTNKLTFKADTKYLDFEFRCAVSDGSTTKYSNAVKFSILSITQQPVDRDVVVGKTVTYSVKAPNATAFQWQYYNGSAWKDATNATVWKGNNTNTLTFTSNKKYDGFKFRCVTSAGTTKLTSKSVRYKAIDITSQPESATVASGEEVVFSITAPGATSYQWQYNKGSGWKNATNNTVWVGNATDTLTFVADKKYEDFQFRCVIKDSAGGALASQPVSFEIFRYTITYDAGEGLINGSRFAEDKTEPGTYIIGLKDANGSEMIPEYQNHVFIGWRHNGRLASNITVLTDTTVVAEWEPACKIKYNPNGGAFSEDTIEYAERNGFTLEGNCLVQAKAPGTYYVSQLFEPEKEGYTFKGWKQGNAYVRMVTTNNPSSATELVAEWEKTVTITYDADGGYWLFDEDEGPFDTVDVQVSAGYNYLGWHEPQRDGYIFCGWKTADGRNKVKVYVEGDITVKALWQKVYAVTYHANGGSFFPEEYHNDRNYSVGDTCEYNRQFYECISAIFVPEEWDSSKWREIDVIEENVQWQRGGTYWVDNNAPFREGYEFLGWSGIPDARMGESGFRISLMGDQDYYATWVKQDVTVTFDANGGYIPWGEGEEHQDYDTLVLSSDPWQGIECVWAEQEDREAYYLLGWSENKNATEAQYNHHQRIYPQDSKTLYAVWEKRAVINFDGNGGTWRWPEWDDAVGENIEVVAEERTEYRDNGQYYYVRTWNPEREGYRFDGWLDKDNNRVDESECITLDASKEYSYKAIWIKQIHITYDANGGDWGLDDEDNPVTEKYWDGDEGEVHIGMEWPNQNDFTFVGWSLDPNADPVEEDIETDFEVVLNDDATYYAIWCTPFEVAYDANGGVIYQDDVDTVTVEYQEDIHYGDYELRDGLRREGYEFLGWDENPDATEPRYHERERIQIKKATTFYAIWYQYPQAIYHAGEGQWGDDQNPEKEKMHWSNEGEYYYVGMDEPWREGYEFTGWVDEAGNKADGRLIILDKDYDFYASWSKSINVRYYANGGQFFEWDDAVGEDIAIGKVLDREGRTGEELWLEGWKPRKDMPSEFLGWALTENAGPEDILDNPYIIPTDYEEDELVIYAVWLDYVRVEYYFTGGEFNGEDHFEFYCPPEDNYMVGYDWPYKEGYVFLGWDEDPAATDAEPNYYINLTQDTTFYAIWDEECAVTFDAGEGLFQNGEKSVTQLFRKGDVVERLYHLSGFDSYYDSVPQRDGYMFGGWFYNDEKADYVRVDGDMTLEAYWIKVNVVALDANGGYILEENGEYYLDEDGEMVDYLELNEVAEFTIPANKVEASREGYIFLGWFNSNDEIVDKISFEEEYTLTAKWEAIP